MRLCVTGSIATDHLMTFPGKFADALVAEKLDRLSVSFLVEDLQIRRGGVGANIAFGLGRLGLHPVLVGAVGSDFDDYRSWLERHGVDTSAVHVFAEHGTARFTCTTDSDQNQIASFYAGAMAEARDIELWPIAARLGPFDLVVIGPNEPDAMLRHTEECRDRGFKFAADPSQQLASMPGSQIAELIDGAEYLFCNEYEAALIEKKTGWTAEEILKRVRVRVTTLGPNGARIESQGAQQVEVGCPREHRKADPTGVGDAFRSGFLAGIAWGLPWERCAQVGSMLATLVIETVGTQEYEFDPHSFAKRLRQAYGSHAATEIAQHLAVA